MASALRPNRLKLSTLRTGIIEGWRLANATRTVSFAYAFVFAAIGAVIIAALLAAGLTPFVVAAAGAFMLVGPILLAGFFGIASAHESGERVRPAAIAEGFRRAAPSVWVLALVCALLFMIFITDAAILYSYMVGGAPVWLGALLPAQAGVLRFVLWASVSGLVVAVMLFAVAAFAVPLLCERRVGLVDAVVTSVRIVFGNFLVAMTWGLVLSIVIVGSILLLPLLPLTLPWLAFASRSVYRQAIPRGGANGLAGAPVARDNGGNT